MESKGGIIAVRGSAADARLIAAAPEMAALLMEERAWAGCFCTMVRKDDKHDANCTWPDWLARYEALRARIQGEAPHPLRGAVPSETVGGSTDTFYLCIYDPGADRRMVALGELKIAVLEAVEDAVLPLVKALAPLARRLVGGEAP